jgi:hypothetical protein
MNERREMKSIVETLKDLRHGDVITDLTVGLIDVVTAVRATGGSGTLTLTLRVKPFSKGDMHTLTIDDDVSLKLPRVEKGATILFANDENQLSRSDPRQPVLEGLRSPATVTPLRGLDKDPAVSE